MSRLATKIDGPVAVIGDVHGHVDKLLTVLDRLRQLRDFDNRWIVFIGDLVDRGPDPKGVIDIVQDLLLTHPRTTVVCGNHELAMAGALQLIPAPEYANWAPRWLDDYGAETTFDSYDVPFGELETLNDALGDSHREFLADLPWVVEHPQYLFVHAGLDANTPFGMQLRILRQRDYTLNRPQWLCSKGYVTSPVPPDCPATVVSGHVRVSAVKFNQKRILIDTSGGEEDGELSCVLLPENRVISSGDDESQRATVESGSGKSWWKLW